MDTLLNNYKIFKVTSCESTMDQCKSLMDNNDIQPDQTCVVLAQSQNNGRGTRGRSWTSDIGNFYLSLGFQCSKKKEIAQLSFVTAVAAGKTVLSYRQDIGLAYKWPNDLFIDDKKVGGILIEARDQNIIVGMGLNLVTSPSFVGYDATNLQDNKIDATPENFLGKFIRNFDLYKTQWMEKGFENIRNEWMSAAWKLNKAVNVKDGKGRLIKGIFKGIDSDGGLIIQHAEKEEVLYSAQIVR
jgi:BirA family biotin operon repressor/biotin-[acetyl-CoA-carboxylase] ligase